MTFIAIIALLLCAAVVTWLLRRNWLIRLACLFLTPLPAAFVMVYWAERFPSEPPETEALRIAIAIPVCYFVVWLSGLTGWLSNKLQESAPPES